MKSVKFLLLAFAAVTTTVLNAQTVDEIISKHVDAIGGKDKLGQVKSVYTENAVFIAVPDINMSSSKWLTIIGFINYSKVDQ